MVEDENRSKSTALQLHEAVEAVCLGFRPDDRVVALTNSLAMAILDEVGPEENWSQLGDLLHIAVHRLQRELGDEARHRWEDKK